MLFRSSPDVMAGGSGESKRFALEDIYMGLIRLKSLTKGIFVTSWPRRKDTTITMESVSEAWAKAWYSDIMIGWTKLGRSPNSGMNNVRLNVPKNRFGPSDNSVVFQYNYANLLWELTEGARSQMESDDDW